MHENDEREHDGGHRASDPRLHDPPKPVVHFDDRSEIAQKLARLTEGLATAPKAASANGVLGTPPPSFITSSSLDEARAYITCVSPAPQDEPTTLGIQRVRVANEVNSVTWITERVEKRGSTAGRAAAPGQIPHGVAGEGGADSLYEPALKDDPEAALWMRRRARTKAAAAGGLTLTLVAFCAGYFLLIGRPTSAQGQPKARPAIQEVAFALEPLKDRPGEPSAQPTQSASSRPLALGGEIEVNPPPRPLTTNWVLPPRIKRDMSSRAPSSTTLKEAPASSGTSNTSSTAPEKAPELIRMEPES